VFELEKQIRLTGEAFADGRTLVDVREGRRAVVVCLEAERAVSEGACPAPLQESESSAGCAGGPRPERMTGSRPDSSRRIVLPHADDVGMCRGANLALMESLGRRSVTTGLVVAPCPWCPKIADDNHCRPHSAIGYQTSAAYAARLRRHAGQVHGPRSPGDRSGSSMVAFICRSTRSPPPKS
jgi:hypothetical protein